MLIHPKDHDHFPPSNLRTQQEKIDYFRESAQKQPLSFYQGMLLALMEVFGVEFLTEEDISTEMPIVTPIVPRNMRQTGFKLEWTESLRSFRNHVGAFYNGNRLYDHAFQNHDVKNTIISTNACLSTPRIAILNRESAVKGRKLLNANALSKATQEEVYDGGQTAPVVYFANTSFLEQVATFSSIDILVAPHGAQNIGVGFMPKCGGLIELFSQGIHFPNYFGSLTHDSGIEYMQYYVSDSTFQVDREEKGHSFKRGLYRNDICPKPQDIILGLHKMIRIWSRCCHEYQSG